MLMIYLTVLVFLKHYADTVIKVVFPFLQRFLCSSAKKQKQETELLLVSLLDEQKDINMLDEFARYSKLQRKIDKTKDDIKQIASKLQQKYLIFQMAFSWTVHIIISMLLLYQVYMHRHMPVLEVPSKLLYPNSLAKIIAFPTSVPGNVGCVFWLVVCKFTFSICSKNFLKNKS